MTDIWKCMSKISAALSPLKIGPKNYQFSMFMGRLRSLTTNSKANIFGKKKRWQFGNGIENGTKSAPKFCKIYWTLLHKRLKVRPYLPTYTEILHRFIARLRTTWSLWRMSANETQRVNRANKFTVNRMLGRPFRNKWVSEAVHFRFSTASRLDDEYLQLQ